MRRPRRGEVETCRGGSCVGGGVDEGGPTRAALRRPLPLDFSPPSLAPLTHARATRRAPSSPVRRRKASGLEEDRAAIGQEPGGGVRNSGRWGRRRGGVATWERKNPGSLAALAEAKREVAPQCVGMGSHHLVCGLN